MKFAQRQSKMQCATQQFWHAIQIRKSRGWLDQALFLFWWLLSMLKRRCCVNKGRVYLKHG